MTAPWLRRASKTDDWEATVALLAIGLNFVVGAAFAFGLIYSDYWLVNCVVDDCLAPGVLTVIYGFVVVDILVFLIAWGLSVVFSTRGWWRVVPPVVGTALTVILGTASLLGVYLGTR